MASVIFSAPMITRHAFIKTQLNNLNFLKIPKQRYLSTSPCSQHKTWPLLCTKLFPWETSTPYSSTDDERNIIKGGNIVEPIDAEQSTELPLLQSKQDIIDMTEQWYLQQPHPPKWPMWLMGPSILLATGMLPTLWLPLSSVFLSPNIAGLLSLLGLDCIFNIGATLFLLMADACARPRQSSSPLKIQVPLPYKLWNMGANLLGFCAPILLIFASHRGSLVPELSFISFAVLLVPYLLLLSVQMLTEMLTWHWKSPVWLVTPIVYEAYRILQLMRSLRLGSEVCAPEWAIASIRLLVSWWVLILGIQLMRVAWFAGLNYGSRLSDEATG
ncbi:uncharacterized protein LOC110027065 [Phalaenopsis equestris]|uniref:uncharacterized protein LOC110027065 n=1 Tax=Phalaenopsis equestris TaxID=78828 RepID=UPI0009E1E185|nr:uncharacterized protein LOC110027065 [Phalaenopsis equestris]XP_020583996.1 uncharacterized protein LOC110027065 [Phalaenopsis equestris]XP_020583997.1 uncharacterized protein LOC110027065 [Phalaenopsis equestris]